MPSRDEKVSAPAAFGESKKTGPALSKPKAGLTIREANTELAELAYSAAISKLTPAEALAGLQAMANSTLTREDVAAPAMKSETVAGILHRTLQRLAEQRADQKGSDPDEVEARALLDSFDGRITEIEQRIDRVLARLDAG